MEKVYLSVVVPFLNEEKNLERLHNELFETLNSLDKKCEIIYVNDGSYDSSLEVLEKALSKQNSHKTTVKLINFKKNFGQTAAISAGIDTAEGRLVSFLDADLQNDPNDIPRFLEKIESGYDAAFGWRKNRKDKTLRSVLSKVANVMIQKLFNYPFHDVGCSARVVKKEFLSDLQLYGELHRILPVLIFFKGAKVAEVTVHHRRRFKGKSKYGFDRIVKTLVDLITVKFLQSYGTKPAYVFGTLGLVTMFLGFVTLVAVSYRKLFLGVFVHRDPLFLITIFFVLLGVQFVMMGLLAELQVRTYFESQSKPIYEIKDIQHY